MTIKSITSENKVDQVFYQMERKILEGAWNLGDKLPSEKELCDMFGVSRVSVRGAIQKLRSVGLIETYQGRGSFVANKIELINNVFPKMKISEKDFLDIIEFRQLVEYKSIELAVERADEKDIETIEHALNKMLTNKNDYKKYSVADYEFHIAIVKASKNKILYAVMENIKDIFHYYLEELNRVFGISEESIEGHVKLLNALKNKNATTAKEIIEEGIQENLSKLKF